jgi:hypothetical protein
MPEHSARGTVAETPKLGVALGGRGRSQGVPRLGRRAATDEHGLAVPIWSLPSH